MVRDFPTDCKNFLRQNFFELPECDAPVRTDQFAAAPDTKLVVLAVMAEHLSVHRNYLIYLRKTTGMTLGQIFVQQLRDRGMADGEILRMAHTLNQETAKRWSAESPLWQSSISSVSSARPILFLSTGVDHNSSGTFFSTIPEIGVDRRKGTFWIGIPYYENRGTTLKAGGIGDVYATGLLRGSAEHFDVTGSIRSASLRANRVYDEGVQTGCGSVWDGS